MKKYTMTEFRGGGGKMNPPTYKGFKKFKGYGLLINFIWRFIFFKQLAGSLSFRKQIPQELLREETE